MIVTHKVIVTSPAVAAQLAARSVEAEREQVRVNIALAVVNGHITRPEAAEARLALADAWTADGGA